MPGRYVNFDATLAWQEGFWKDWEEREAYLSYVPSRTIRDGFWQFALVENRTNWKFPC